MSVRAKMTAGHVNEGEVYFNAVYEGDNALQLVSENSIFGEATPSGSLLLSGPDLAGKFESGEEYYVDIAMDAGRAQWPADDPRGQIAPALVTLPGRCAYRSPTNPNNPNWTQFRYVAVGRGTHFDLSMGIANPAATEWLDNVDGDIVLRVRLARGRRSDAEIAAREAHLVAYEADLRTRYAGKAPAYFNFDGSFDAFIDQQTASYRRKLAIAKGEIL